ncbi:MAG: alpha/beta hydrolase [Clostridia bacterium]|nr:alpha/beta hydrolase [Clostridia bacterium]
MKRIIAVILLLCAVLLYGCNTDGNGTSSKDSTNIPDQNIPQSSIEEKHFVLESDGYKLNAVYTYIDDGKSHPAVLLIAGSGPSDYDEAIGALKPFKDIANGLAKKGINSLRVDKRTFNYAADFNTRYGIEEEYLNDCTAAIKYLKSQNISDLYLLGHSLGGQIATELAVSNADIDGMILFNSSARHLADIACDQYSALDPVNKASYTAYAEAAKNATDSSAKGYYYYGASDYYWVSYNQIDTIKNISEANIKALIINSKFDKQSFDKDLDLWSTHLSNSSSVSIRVYDDISHFGYKIDTTDPSSLYTQADFPSEVISAFADFIKGD